MAPQTASASGSKASKIRDDQWPSYSAYRTLNSGTQEIRLLTITGLNHENVLQCSLKHAILDDKPEYHALSYYWGAPVLQKDLLPITVDGSMVFVRPTMSAFLHNMYAQVGSVVVWLDALCINQNNVKERSQQVSLMGDIFASAMGVYAWLGEANADTDYAFDALNGDLVAEEVNFTILAQFVKDILLRPYWIRQWVVQEFVMARTLTLVCGAKTLPWALFDQHMRQMPHEEYAEHWKRYQRLEEGRKSYHDLVPSPDWLRTTEKGLYRLMASFEACRCTDHRDKVYALLGLSQESSLVPADYSISTADLFYKVLSLHPPLTNRSICEHGSSSFAMDACEPIEAASRIQKAMGITSSDLIDHLEHKAADRLYAWFDLVGYIDGTYAGPDNGVWPPMAVALKNYVTSATSGQIFTTRATNGNHSSCYIPTHRDLHQGDLVYRARGTVNGSGHTYLIFRSLTHTIVDLVVVEYDRRPAIGTVNILEACLPGMRICSMSWQPRAKRNELLLIHLSRQAHYVLWLQPGDSSDKAVSDRIGTQVLGPSPECQCLPNKIGKNCNATWEEGLVRPPELFLACHTIIKVKEFLAPMRPMMYARPH